MAFKVTICDLKLLVFNCFIFFSSYHLQYLDYGTIPI